MSRRRYADRARFDLVGVFRGMFPRSNRNVTFRTSLHKDFFRIFDTTERDLTPSPNPSNRSHIRTLPARLRPGSNQYTVAYRMGVGAS